jgi:hypothetical protein
VVDKQAPKEVTATTTHATTTKTNPIKSFTVKAVNWFKW